MQRDGQPDEDGCREHQSTKPQRRDGSVLRIRHFRSSRYLLGLHETGGWRDNVRALACTSLWCASFRTPATRTKWVGLVLATSHDSLLYCM